jgi:alpha-beta hydrolase superfamily lysophospholipase
MQALDTEIVNPIAGTALLSPGHRTEKAIVFLHGLTNSPPQFRPLAERFVERGFSVFIPRLPYHGYVDRMTTDLAKLTAEEMVAQVAESIDIAHGLADDVGVAGISLGGVLAAWAAQFRADVAQATLIAPAFTPKPLPVSLTRLFDAALLRWSNRFPWWDPRYKENMPGPKHAYPRWSTHSLARAQDLGLAIRAAARQTPPAAKSVWVVTIGSDLAVNNRAAASLVASWRKVGATNVQAFEFPLRLRLFHDIVDPEQSYAKIDVTFPPLVSIIADGTAPDLETLGQAPEPASAPGVHQA